MGSSTMIKLIDWITSLNIALSLRHWKNNEETWHYHSQVIFYFCSYSFPILSWVFEDNRIFYKWKYVLVKKCRFATKNLTLLPRIAIKLHKPGRLDFAEWYFIQSFTECQYYNWDIMDSPFASASSTGVANVLRQTRSQTAKPKLTSKSARN